MLCSLSLSPQTVPSWMNGILRYLVFPTHIQSAGDFGEHMDGVECIRNRAIAMAAKRTTMNPEHRVWDAVPIEF